MLNLRTREAREREHRAQDRLRRRVESIFRRRLTAEFERLAREVATDLGRDEHAITRHESRLEILLRSAYRLVFMEFTPRVLSRLKAVPNGKSMEDLEMEIKAEIDGEYQDAVEAFVKRWTARKATQISNTSRTKIQRIITRSTVDGLNEKETAKLIMERIGGSMGARRARTIARTEVHSASQDAALEIVQASGIDVMKEWVSVEDDRTREDHQDVDGEELAMHEHFKVGDSELLYPGDPSGLPEQIINCRCVLVYNRKED